MIGIILSILSKLIEIYSFCIIIYALLSWFPGAYQTKFGKAIITIVRPYLSLFSRLPLQFAGIDFSVIVALMVLQFAFQGLVILVSSFF
ncbi:MULTISPECIES: YggT family protein [unclassified Enterococcus]|uniref:YggT family protein n=1 Tax=unclassified Enterococcus TaxID=2608891 RepID=UPI001554D9B8|nr:MULTISPECIES: YggT family protein [unclassified Enterococcus]MBS7577649.1 YggT family protein [Enterococcus sp. MMGLQ5-2]MBS7584157.1 YggT family protein [Enterococcus sp. MMGLQ5-1]NPD12015.1 YggT family protein [Enterococcus sp. MMGLQ5-1]NPD37482.1 YggT family protein [Enterococcus sp. MMGLQ5-2]